MRIGMRKPSVKRMIKARTTGRAKRAVKKAVIPGYGRYGVCEEPEALRERGHLPPHDFQRVGFVQVAKPTLVYCMYNVSTVIQGGEHYEYNS